MAFGVPVNERTPEHAKHIAALQQHQIERQLRNVARGKTEAIFLLDSKTNTLLPLKYAGNDSGTRQVFNKVLDGPLVLYYTPDYTKASGWRRLTIDFASSLIWTQDVPRPNAKLGN